ncbi:conserved hypothetical protein [Ricinus communis]|uniref:Metallo-beta-lactamase domain-containing protein n=1 Tax=Ricinus communis TaxID=3988 RepID=B9TAU5_RICCO|nr:conserved hypothetical protein [Ricinus communis]
MTLVAAGRQLPLVLPPADFQCVRLHPRIQGANDAAQRYPQRCQRIFNMRRNGLVAHATYQAMLLKTAQGLDQHLFRYATNAPSQLSWLTIISHKLPVAAVDVVNVVDAVETVYLTLMVIVMKLIVLIFASVLSAMSAATVHAADGPQLAAAQTFSQAPGIYRVLVGDFKVTVLTDGTAPVPFDQIMHGMDKHALTAQFRDAGEPVNRETSINAFLIDTGERRILIDSGAGKVFGSCCGHLVETLKIAGYDPASIDAVLLTHVHGDHSAGLARDGERQFPNADVFLAKSELDYWMSDSAKAQAKASHQQIPHRDEHGDHTDQQGIRPGCATGRHGL